MKKQKSIEKQAPNVSRRTLIKTGALAAFGAALPPSLAAKPATPPVEYGNTQGKTKLAAETVFPLLAAWLMLTTHGKDPSWVHPDAIACVANLHPNSVKTIMNHYNAGEFKAVRVAFGRVAKELSENDTSLPYGGGQCPETIDTIVPVASLLGTPTTVLCGPKFEKPSKSTN
jgi:uncharacterized protein (DUF1501 family)